MAAVRVPLSGVLPTGGLVVPPPLPPVEPPTNVILPDVSGNTVEDETLTAGTGTWSQTVNSYAFQWRRCNAAGTSCSDIAGADDATYDLVLADVGSTVRVVVTATNDDGSTSATSAQTGVVAAAPAGAGPPSNASLPTLSGTPTVGQVFNASPGGWDGDTPITYGYQWRRCNAAGASCADIGGQTAAAYTAQAADEGNTLRVRVTATNSGGSAFADSAASGVIEDVPAPAAGFTNLNRTLQAHGGTTSQGVYRGLTDGSEKYYVVHAYRSDTGDLVAINPSDWSHIVYPLPVAGQEGAWAMAYHPVEKNLYLGSYLNGRVFKFNTTTQAFTDHGNAAGLQYVWDMTYSPFNQKIYGVGSNGSKLFRLDGTTIVDLGTVDSTSGNQYARWVVADRNPAQPYLYIGVGVGSARLIAYNINTGVKTLLSTGGTGTFTVDRTETDEVYAYWAAGPHLRCSAGAATAWTFHVPFNENKFANGNKIDVTSGSIVVTLAAGGTQTHAYPYAGKAMEMWRIGEGPDGKIYGSAAIPAWLGRLYNPASPSDAFALLGRMGTGQIYSFLAHDSRLWMGQYGQNHIFLKYDPTQPVSPLPFVAGGANSNPQTATGTPDWRPDTLISAPDGKLYATTTASYGQTSGRVIKIDPATRVVSQLTPYSDQGVNSLMVTPTAALGIAGSWALLGATSVFPSTATSELFTVNPATFATVTKKPMPITGIFYCTDLVHDGTHCYMIGTNRTHTQSWVFKYNHATNAFVGSGTLLSWTKPIYNSAVVYQSNIVGLSQQGVWSIPLADLTAGSIVNFPTWPAAHINTGFHFDAGTWYFTSGTELWEYVMP